MTAPDAQSPRRLHPLTPVLRGWRLLAALVAVAVPQSGDVVRGNGPGLGTLGLASLGLAVAALVYGFLSWRMTRYAVHDGALLIESGIVVKKSRRVRLDRLQAVDVVQPVLARFLGLAELRLEVVGGGRSEAPLSYLSVADAHGVRAQLLAVAAGIDETTPEAPERVLHEVPAGRLVASTLLSPGVIVSLALVPVAVVVATVKSGPGSLIFLLPTVYGVGSALVQGLLGSWGFTLAESPDGLRIRRGLLETRAQTVPPGRIQAVRLVEPWLWRRLTWVRVEVNVAGYSRQEDRKGSGLLLPVAPRSEALALLARVLPGVDLDAVELTGVPRAARLLDPWSWSRLAAGSDTRFFVARRGRLRRETDVLPHERTQSVRSTQGPLQRALGLATVRLDTTPGPVKVTAAHRTARQARAMVAEQAERARTARSTALPEQWMAQETAGGSTGGAAVSGSRGSTAV